MRTRRQRGVVGAAAILLTLFTATACSSETSDSVADSLAPATMDTTASGTDSPGIEAPDTDTPAETDTATAETAETAEEPAPPTSDPAPADPAVVVPEALQFTAALVGGGTFDGAALTDKPTVFWFWAPT